MLLLRNSLVIYHFVAWNSAFPRGGGRAQTGISTLTGRFQDIVNKELCAEYTGLYRRIGHRSVFCRYSCMTRHSHERKQSRSACANIGPPSCEDILQAPLFARFKRTWRSSLPLTCRCKSCLEVNRLSSLVSPLILSYLVDSLRSVYLQLQRTWFRDTHTTPHNHSPPCFLCRLFSTLPPQGHLIVTDFPQARSHHRQQNLVPRILHFQTGRRCLSTKCPRMRPSLLRASQKGP